KTKETDGYTAVQVGASPAREKRTNKAAMGHFQKANVAPQRYIKEHRIGDADLSKLNVGDKMGLDIIKDAKSEDWTGISKARAAARRPARCTRASAWPAAWATSE